MKAVLCKEYGPPESLVVEDVDPPAIHDDGVRIRVHAAGVNFPDVLMIKGEYQFKPPFPFSPGGEVAGEVTEVGRRRRSVTASSASSGAEDSPRRSWPTRPA